MVRTVIDRFSARNRIQTHGRSDSDDQNTLMSASHDAALELDSVFSGSSTIGDLERLGYVNRSPRFVSGRTVIFASIVLSKGFFAWENQATFDEFINNRRKFEKCLESGSGWPLFHFVSIGFKSYFNKNVPVNKVYKYKVVDNDKVDDIRELNKELVCKNATKSLYKVEFCCIFRNVSNSQGLAFHKFVCFQPDGTRTPVFLLNKIGRKHSDCQIFEPITGTTLNLRWLGTTGYTSVFGSNDLKLVVLDDQTPHLSHRLNGDTGSGQPEPEGNRSTRPLSTMPLWARYSRAVSIIPIPKRRVLKLATFEIGEVEETSDVPFTTELLTCMCMYLHELESRKERRTPLTTSPMFTVPFVDLV
ncbi:unnamed protein product [Kluyveromyces dobzhanskii CBS 2104]|uniref:WGS project CCBQ000000000 data, contig 00104 n=1 Tax=Kluyveromyces dobzhanskii CBS 2104 TaxID=1427455 RepID=A0A0A8L3K1_9SACH|nr:unnamed protein product [Kluyveromyces dobzhanskii CBS 2104]